jgi:hypothetical protein
MRPLFLVLLAAPLAIAQDSPPDAAPPTLPIAPILAVGPEGQGNAAAAEAWASLAKADIDRLPDVLAAMDGASPLAANWLRAAASAIVDRQRAAGQALPVAQLGQLLFDLQQSPRAREYAFELLEEETPETVDQLVPGFLNDPSPALRRRAVAALIDQGKGLADADPARASLIFRQALGAAVEEDQIKALATSLEDLDQPVDLPRHFGFLTHWHVAAPFDNTGRTGFDTAFDPEQFPVDLAASYQGKDDAQVAWQPLVSRDPFGVVDLNRPFGMLKETTGYAFTAFEIDAARPAELRLACKNAWKIWLNGELIFARDEYHRGMRIDQYRLPVQLQRGTNQLLVKLCQNEQTETWTVEWQFQLRLADETGTAILATDRPPTPEPEQAPERRPRRGRD